MFRYFQVGRTIVDENGGARSETGPSGCGGYFQVSIIRACHLTDVSVMSERENLREMER